MTNAANAIAVIPTDLKRRNFLIAAGLGVGTAVVVGAGTLNADPPASSSEKQSTGRGYQSTEHVRNYYRTARI